MTQEFWIPVDYNETTAKNLSLALDACYAMHVHTLAKLNEHFIAHLEPMKLGEYRDELYDYVRRDNSVLERVQQYSLRRAAEKTFPYFNANRRFTKQMKFVPVKPIPREKYHDLHIETRKVWRKFLALSSYITTAYGTIYLDESWPEILREQLKQKEIIFSAAPFMWHSVTVRAVPNEKSCLQFNLHEPNTKFERKAKKEMKKEYGRV